MKSLTEVTPNKLARLAVDAVSDYLDNTARAHNCAGFDCRVCALNGDRLAEARGAAEDAIGKVEKAYQSVPVILRLIDALGSALSANNSTGTRESYLMLSEAVGRLEGQAAICRIEMDVYGGAR